MRIPARASAATATLPRGRRIWIATTRLIARMWPEGTRPRTAVPLLIPHGPDHDGLDPLVEGAVLSFPVYLQWFCPTQGASIGYRWNADNSAPWQLAGPPVQLAVVTYTIEAKAVRTGFAESAVASWNFIVASNTGKPI